MGRTEKVKGNCAFLETFRGISLVSGLVFYTSVRALVISVMNLESSYTPALLCPISGLVLNFELP